MGVRHEASAHSVQTVPVSHKLQGDGHLRNGFAPALPPGKMGRATNGHGPCCQVTCCNFHQRCWYRSHNNLGGGISYLMMSRCVKFGCVCFNRRVVSGQGGRRPTKYANKHYSSDSRSSPTHLYTQISIPVCTSCSPGPLTPLRQKARPAGHSDLHWPYSVRCVKCRQTVHSFWQEIQTPGVW